MFVLKLEKIRTAAFERTHLKNITEVCHQCVCLTSIYFILDKQLKENISQLHGLIEMGSN